MGTCRLPFRRSSSKLCATLDLSRGLRMDETNLPKSASGFVEPVGPEQGRPPGAGASVVFFGDPALVAEGFAIALRAMRIAINPNRENDHA